MVLSCFFQKSGNSQCISWVVCVFVCPPPGAPHFAVVMQRPAPVPGLGCGVVDAEVVSFVIGDVLSQGQWFS